MTEVSPTAGQALDLLVGAPAGGGLGQRNLIAVAETVILLHPPLPWVSVSIAMERERRHNDRTLVNGGRAASGDGCCTRAEECIR